MSIDKNLYPLSGVYRQELTKLRKQRNELLAIVKRLRQAYSYSLIRPAAHDGCTCPDCVLFRDADAAIAACEEKTDG